DQQQAQNFQALQSSHRPCILFDQDVASFWNHWDMDAAMDAPMIHWMNESYCSAVSASSWQLLVPKARKDAVLIQSDGAERTISLKPQTATQP
ncbi:MAG: hypothetical protein JO353_08100, partial [Phycisphaerae bacterium]|nr:hypothetical protein [Phycisphaerae bacterium]